MDMYRRIRKKLYRALKRAQADDVPIPAPRIVEIRFYIKNDRRAQHIIVDNDNSLESSQSGPPSWDPSKFILSQLQAQKIADISRTPKQLLAVLAITSTYLAKYPAEPPAYPTCFTWHSHEAHRTYCVFAYLTCPMESRVYSASELLELRNAYASLLTPDMIDFNTDIAEIIKKKNGVPPTQHGRLKKMKGDISSSTEESEEQILFKGKKQRPTANGRMEWRYRGRSSSEVTSNEPIAAPAGLAAQRSEGFQRFFKAVVSPTHVRVTAGGRIVPNTRATATASPTNKAEKGQADQEAQEPTGTINNEKLDGGDEANGSSYTAAGNHMMLQGPPGAFPHLGLPVPLIPMHNGIPLSYGFQQPHQSQSAVPTAAPTSIRAAADGERPSSMSQTAQANGTHKSRPGLVGISAPEKFDHTKPYYYNGHLVLPVQGHAPMLVPGPYPPQNIAGNQAAVFPPQVAQMGQPSTFPMLAPARFMPGSYGPGPAHAGTQAAQIHSVRANQLVTPPMSSIRPSDVTKQQLTHLRNCLQYLETQLLYNKHQIDEKAVRERADRFKDDIRGFEHKLKMQLDFEAAHYPGQAQGPQVLATAPVHPTAPHNLSSRPASMKENRSDNISRDDSIDSGKQLAHAGNKESSNHSRRRGKGHKNRKAVGINSFKCDAEQSKSTALDDLEAHHRGALGLERKYCVAPDPAFSQGLQLAADTSAPSVSGDGQNESRPWCAGEDNADLSRPVGKDFIARGGSQFVDHGGIPFTNHQAPGLTALRATPYLIGKLPHGVNPFGARSTDYLYPRELTEEEKRARHVYWGQVPTKGTGLPKFDGKDFYPPSPVKVDGKFTPSPALPPGQSGVNHTVRVPSTDNDPFRSNRDGASMRSQESGHKVSRAIPIVNPDTGKLANAHLAVAKDPKKPSDGAKATPPTSIQEQAADEKLPVDNNQGSEKASNKSGHDLWQTMLKKGPPSGTALPSAVSSTTATGYLPQYSGHAAASLGPAISNAVSSTARLTSGSDSKLHELDNGVSKGPADKLGENRPPREGSAPDSDPSENIHEQIIHNPEHRGLVAPRWQ